MSAWRVEPCRGRYVDAAAAGRVHAALLEVTVHHEVGHLAVARAAAPVQPHHVEAVVVFLCAGPYNSHAAACQLLDDEL